MPHSAAASSACWMATWYRTRSRRADPMRNYLVVLFRNLRREKLYAAINIAGLALGIACCLILGLFLRNELTYDRHHAKHARIYRVVDEFTTAGKADTFAVTSPFLGPLLKADFPQIEAVVRFQRNAGDA